MELPGLFLAIMAFVAVIMCAMPFKMTINRRANLLTASGTAFFVGLQIYREAISPGTVNIESYIVVNIFGFLLAVFGRRRVKSILEGYRNIMLEELKRVPMPKGLSGELARRYLEIDR